MKLLLYLAMCKNSVTNYAQSKMIQKFPECVEESDGHLHIFIPSTDSEKGSSRDSMAAGRSSLHLFYYIEL